MNLAILTVLSLAFSPPSAHALETSIQFDERALKPKLLNLIKGDLEAIASMQFAEASDSDFAKLFGGTSGTDVIHYLEERVFYIGTDPSPDNADNYAENFSPEFLTYAYHHDLLHEPEAKPETANFRGSTIEITSPRTGFVAVGPVYTAATTTQVDRLDTLVHEARHSDCPEVSSEEDLKAWDDDKPLKVSVPGRRCTQMHMPCPKGHPLAGELACDGHDWGAYEVAYIFSRAIQNDCLNCTDQQRAEAKNTADDDFTRLLKPVQEHLLTRVDLPEPDMSSIR